MTQILTPAARFYFVALANRWGSCPEVLEARDWAGAFLEGCLRIEMAESRLNETLAGFLVHL